MALNVVPTEDELRAALLGLRKENPTIGISKLHTQLLSTNSTWAVSEKRTRKVLQSEGLVLSQHSRPLDNKSQIYIFPSSNVIESLDVSKWSSRVEVKYFGRVKGKGLVAKELLAAGETVWKEDPFVLAPEWYALVPHFQNLTNERKLAGTSTTCRHRLDRVRSAVRLSPLLRWSHHVPDHPRGSPVPHTSAIGFACYALPKRTLCYVLPKILHQPHC